jgi:hypothetical protein
MLSFATVGRFRRGIGVLPTWRTVHDPEGFPGIGELGAMFSTVLRREHVNHRTPYEFRPAFSVSTTP